MAHSLDDTSTPVPASKSSSKSTSKSTGSSSSKKSSGSSHASGAPAGVSVSAQDWQLVRQIAGKYGIDPYLLVAIGIHETGWGSLGAGRDGFALGVGVPDGGGENGTYHGLAAQLDGAARILAHYHVKTVQDLASGALAPQGGHVRYASDPHWTQGVVSAYNQIKGTTFAATVSSTVRGAGGGEATSASASSKVALDMGTLEKEYGTVAVVLKNPELQALVKQAVANGWDDATFTQKLYSTQFYKKHSDDQRNWLLLKATDPGEASKEIGKRTQEVRDEAVKLGVTLGTKDLAQIVDDSLYNNMDQGTLAEAIGAHYAQLNSHALGAAGTMQDQFTKAAADYGVPVSSQTITGWIKGVLSGKMDQASVQSLVEQQALSLYPGLAQQLKSGMTVADVAGPYRDAMAQILELNPASVNLTDPTVKKALQYTPDPTKPPSLMPMYAFEQGLRNDPRWLKTDNARQSATDTGIQILKDWGFTAA